MTREELAGHRQQFEVVAREARTFFDETTAKSGMALLAEVERLRALVREAYLEAWDTGVEYGQAVPDADVLTGTWAADRENGWDHCEARKALGDA